jgi:hypothetical protein
MMVRHAAEPGSMAIGRNCPTSSVPPELAYIRTTCRTVPHLSSDLERYLPRRYRGDVHCTAPGCHWRQSVLSAYQVVWRHRERFLSPNTPMGARPRAPADASRLSWRIRRESVSERCYGDEKRQVMAMLTRQQKTQQQGYRCNIQA